jgi:N-acetylmuramic acid 6-phosphate etherase
MIDLQPTNQKLRLRTRRILRELAGVTDDEAAALLAQTSGRLKPALVAALAGVGTAEADALLAEHGGHVHAAVKAVTGVSPR